MSFLRSSTPLKSKEFQNQNDISHISDEEFESLKAPYQFTTQQKLYHFLCFIVFFGIIRLLLIVFIVIFASFLILGYKFALTAFQFPSKAGKSFCLSIARFGIRSVLFLLGIVYINTDGQFDDGARFVISNHIGLLDAFVILYFHDLTIIVDQVYRTYPFISLLLDSVNAVYIDPRKPKYRTKMIIDVVDDFSNSPVLVFPEGAPSGRGAALMKYEKTAFSTPYKVQPITMRYHMFGVPYGYNTYGYQGENLFYYIYRLLSMPPSLLSIHFLPYMSMEKDAKSEVKAFSHNAQLNMANFIGIRAVDHSCSVMKKDKTD
ncbi:Acyltransferase family protein [Trichomonas vaginalis G3]|uniref:Acyltransferase family protein n=1 Tax=Trichomonas vaginalis (strain ATCC PRA-98 / G3) TaxID=412133 RepID=A2E5R7_TRIV3|nr:1-alkylglycerophosphocholine O-acetyltransferase protein [Trichomonas vaginalis G3]EAY11987.1 Acyltransferase family protein [Trichomonas vaginalis G3]KAI5524838.1 1-alkylglycerophosphocholine O-acetyltransferase protein [Trichomonas vaginalis G3]|eukprot:XP_001324210.1 Acyltransferase family protein [Trichomonas vaginalis G3]